MLGKLKTFGEVVRFALWVVPVTVTFTLYTCYWKAVAKLKGEFFDDEEEGEDWELLTAAWTGRGYRHEA